MIRVKEVWVRKDNWDAWAMVFVPDLVFTMGSDAIFDWIISTFGWTEFQWQTVVPATTAGDA